LLTASPPAAIPASAFLAALRRIDSKQANAFAMDFNGVSVDDARYANDLSFLRGCRSCRK
jgi:hypothetical protein